jgi:hypothetical protein
VKARIPTIMACVQQYQGWSLGGGVSTVNGRPLQCKNVIVWRLQAIVVGWQRRGVCQQAVWCMQASICASCRQCDVDPGTVYMQVEPSHLLPAQLCRILWTAYCRRCRQMLLSGELAGWPFGHHGNVPDACDYHGGQSIMRGVLQCIQSVSRVPTW